jgi:hypothetical protein
LNGLVARLGYSTYTSLTPQSGDGLGTTYEPPRLIEIGGVYELTLDGCFMDKKWGGTDGLSFGPITIPVSSC